MSFRQESSQEIPALYHDSVMAKLRQVRYDAITTDLWKSSTCERYITLTIYYIDGEWCLKSNCLDTVALFADHTGDNIAKGVTDILANWELETQNLVAATTDSGANVISAFRVLELLIKDKLIWAEFGSCSKERSQWLYNITCPG